MKKLFFIVSLICIAVIAAIGQATVMQADTVVFPQPDQIPSKGEQSWLEYLGTLVSYLFANWRDILGVASALVMAFEVAVSVIPTSKDWSILTKIRAWLDNARGISLLTKNRKAGGGAFKVKSEPEDD